MGELFVNQAEYVPLIRDRLIDFIRAHLCAIGGPQRVMNTRRFTTSQTI